MNARPRSRVEQVRAGCVVAIPLIETFWHLCVYGGPDLISTSLLVVMWLLTGFGITIGFHRYFTHQSFKVAHTCSAYVLGILGSMALEGFLSAWITDHRTHHQHVDRQGDPHSPHRYGSGFVNITRGFAYAHVGWFFVDPVREPQQLVRDDLIIQRIDRLMLPAFIAGLVLPGLVGAFLRGSFGSFFEDVAWGGITRVAIVHHFTWSVNSVCHLWGTRPFQTRDRSTNNKIVAVCSLGEGNHNGHHKFPRSACHGLRPGDIDPSYNVIRQFERIGWFTDVNVPTKEQIEKALLN